MLKKLLAIILCVICLFSFTGCSLTKDDVSSVSDPEYIDLTEDVNDKKEEEEKFINPLTGIKNLTKSNVGTRPVAVMVNNISTAQGVQT
ncbi:MAG: hypothetical protein J6T73_04845, partial [Clostridia bacterium]|nr:hypothetical protein [Clostridia bacterium]